MEPTQAFSLKLAETTTPDGYKVPVVVQQGFKITKIFQRAITLNPTPQPSTDKHLFLQFLLPEEQTTLQVKTFEHVCQGGCHRYLVDYRPCAAHMRYNIVRVELINQEDEVNGND